MICSNTTYISENDTTVNDAGHPVSKESETIDLDKFFIEMEEPIPHIVNKNENLDNTNTIEILADDIGIKPINSFNNIEANENLEINEVISISSDEESPLEDIEDDIPLSILLKNKNDNNTKLENVCSNTVKVVNIVTCAEVKAINTLTDENLISENDFKMIHVTSHIKLNDPFDDSGYHSSDFEFITESEAKLAGIIKNKRKNISRTHSKSAYDRINNLYSNYSNDYRQNHIIPEGENYRRLFEGNYAPMLTGFMENKAGMPSKMSIDFEGIGFNMRMHYKKADNSEFLEEANNVGKMISRLYPDENKCKKKRRRHN